MIVSTAVMESFSALGCAVGRNSEHFGPAGHHLRWFCSATLGYPAGGVDIWHLDEQEWINTATKMSARAALTSPAVWIPATNWSGRDRHHPFHRDAVLISRADALWKPNRSGLQVADAGAGASFVIHFNQPVIAVRLVVNIRAGIGATSGRTVSVRHGARELETIPLASEMVIKRPSVTDLVVPNTIAEITELSFLTEIAAAEVIERNGQFRTHLDLPDNVTEAYDLTDITNGLKNRFFVGTSAEAFKQAYRPKHVRQLVEHLHNTVGSPDHTITAAARPDTTAATVTVLDHLRLASVDPNIARMLASYWVDPTPRPGVYLIRADYASPDKKLGFGFVFTDHTTDAPKLSGAHGKQLPGIEYRNRDPLGRVGLTFDGLESSHGRERTILVDVRRHTQDGEKWLTEQRPHLVNAGSSTGFTDTRLALPGSVKYEVTPIDIFGRLGTGAVAEVTLVDLRRPTPPKHIRTALAQHGAPWLDASKRSDQDRTATLDATAEFAEAQLTVSPDVHEIIWCWRSDPSDRDPAVWHKLATSKVVPPKTITVTWKNGEPVSAAPLKVARARLVDHNAMNDQLERLDAVTRAAVDAVPAVPALVELLLQSAVLEPEVFTGYVVRVGSSTVTVMGSTAGIGAADDTTDGQKMTARLFLPFTADTVAITPATQLTVQHPKGVEWTPESDTPPPLINVPLPPGTDLDQPSKGGEVAIELSDSFGESTIVGRVVSDHRPTGIWSVLLRVRPSDADRLLQIERNGADRSLRVRHHLPYVLPRHSIGVDGASGELPVDFTPEQKFAAIWVSAYTSDASGLMSTQVAMPSEVRIVRPPPSAQPTAPYPEADGSNAKVGQLSPPDVDGIATASLAWAPINVGSAADHVRYEVGRALATTIVAADRERWFRGADVATGVGVLPGPSATTTTNGVVINPNNGTLRLGIETITTTNVDASAFSGGRVKLGTGTSARTHRLLRIAASANGGMELLIRPTVSIQESGLLGTPDNTPCAIDVAPSYEAVLADDSLVRQLADLPGTDGRSDDTNNRAFGLVSSTPIGQTRFIDRLPGIGRSRFFYKVRAVYPGESRSVWSAASVSFHQVDTTAAEPILDTSAVRSTAGESIISFRLPPDPLVVGIRIATLAADGSVLTSRDEYVTPESGQHELAPARITSSGGILDIQAHVGSAALDRHRSASGTAPRVLRLFPTDVDHASPPSTDLLPTGDLSRSVAIGRKHDSTALTFAVRKPDGSIEWIVGVPGRFETVVMPTPGGASVSLAALKFVSVAGTAHPFHSEPTLLAAPPHDDDGDDDADG